jgi:hypothetical protein
MPNAMRCQWDVQIWLEVKLIRHGGNKKTEGALAPSVFETYRFIRKALC